MSLISAVHKIADALGMAALHDEIDEVEGVKPEEDGGEDSNATA